MRAGFIWDDDDYVTHNPLLTAPDGLRRIWFSLDSPSQYFPLTYTSFRIERSLWGLDPAGYHWVNLLLHAANALLAWCLLKRLAVPGAWLAAAIFALHPVHVESVAWITERKNVLSLFFSLLALLAWVGFVDESNRRRWRFYGGALFFYALALFSKTTACTLPAALLLVLWLKEKPVSRTRWVQILPFLALGLSMGLVTVWWERFHQGTQGGHFSIGWLERLLIASRALWFYAGKLVWPANLTFSYPRWTINPADPFAYAWLLACVGAGALIYSFRRFVGRSVEVAAAFYVATLMPTLGFIMLYTFIYSFVADHYQYVASLGPLALAAAGITRLFGFQKKGSFLPPVFCGTLLLGLGLLTWRQCGIYRDPETLWRDTLAKNPAAWMAHNNLGIVLAGQGRLTDAIQHYEQALQLNPDYAEAHNNLGNALATRGKLAEAVQSFQRALQLDPDYALAHSNLGFALTRQGRLAEAIQHCERAVQLSPGSADAHLDLGIALARQGRLPEAIAQYGQALRLDPDSAEARMDLGIALARQGRHNEAIPHYEQALRLQPDSAEAHVNLANALTALGKLVDAIPHYERALQLKPDSARAHFNFGNALNLQGKPVLAIQHLQQALALATAQNDSAFAETISNRLQLVPTPGR